MRRVAKPRSKVLTACLLVPVLGLAACDDGRPFSRERIGTAATKLAVPTTLTPPVRVAKIAGAPAGWKLQNRVAEALRDRDIPAAVDLKGPTVYVLRGKIMKSRAGGRARQVAPIKTSAYADPTIASHVVVIGPGFVRYRRSPATGPRSQISMIRHMWIFWSKVLRNGRNYPAHHQKLFPTPIRGGI